MTRSAARPRTPFASLACVAATLSIVFAALLPSVVAASPALGTPVMLCSGQEIRVVYDRDGVPTPVKQRPDGSMDCAMALLAGFTAVPNPPVDVIKAALTEPAVLVPTFQRRPSPPSRAPPRPPSTAPPIA